MYVAMNQVLYETIQGWAKDLYSSHMTTARCQCG